MHLITWNSRGVSVEGYQWRLSQSQPDVMVVQEVGNLPREMGFGGKTYFGKPVKVGMIGDYRCIWCGWSKQDHDGAEITPQNRGNLRCSLAMFYEESGLPHAVWAANGKRPLLKKTVNGWLICNIHAGGKEYIKDALAIARVNGMEKNWAVAGDFNQDPLTVAGYLQNGEFVVEPGVPTRPESGRTLDFAVSNQNGAAAVGPNYGGSDHLSVDIIWP